MSDGDSENESEDDLQMKDATDDDSQQEGNLNKKKHLVYRVQGSDPRHVRSVHGLEKEKQLFWRIVMLIYNLRNYPDYPPVIVVEKHDT